MKQTTKRSLIVMCLIWGLGGLAHAAQVAQQCIPEKYMPQIDLQDGRGPVEFSDLLDGVWQIAQERAGRKTDAPRPSFCFAWEPRMVATPQGFKRLLATYDEVARRADVSLTPKELGKDGLCVIRHEMLHALVGHDEALVRSLQGCTVSIQGGH